VYSESKKFPNILIAVLDGLNFAGGIFGIYSFLNASQSMPLQKSDCLISSKPFEKPILFVGSFFKSPLRSLTLSLVRYSGYLSSSFYILSYITCLLSQKKGGNPVSISNSKAPKL
jgi:hypothetical protein